MRLFVMRSKPSWFALGAFGAFALLASFTAPVQAQTWNGSVDNDWFEAGNWTGGVPNSVTSDADIGPGGTVEFSGNVSINSLTNAATSELTVNAGSNFDFGGTATTTLNNAGSIFTHSNSDFQLSGQVNNSGLINAEAGGANADLEVRAGGATLDGGGTITLSTTGTASSRINGASGAMLTIVDQRIEGAGNIGANLLEIHNQANGIIVANQSGETLRIDTTGTANSNAGALRAFDGGILEIIGSVFDNTGGTIEARDASEVELLNSTISNGTLSTMGSGVVSSAAGSNTFLNDVTNTGTYVGKFNSDTGISGTITNTGSITMTSAGTNADLEVQAGGATLTGGGTVTLTTAGAAASRINGASGSVLTIADQTIEGEGNIGSNLLEIENQSGSLITANVSGKTLTVDTNSAGGVNTGQMQAENGGLLNINGSVLDNDGGTIEAQTGSEVELTNSTIAGGTLTTSGSGVVSTAAGSNTFLEDVTNEGTFVGKFNSDTGISGTITNSGSMTMTSAGTNADLEVQTGGATLDGGGTVTLTTTGAAVSRINGVSGQTLTIADQTIEGEGEIGSNLLNIDNQANGLIDANVAVRELKVDTQGSAGGINSGTIRASNGGVLDIRGSSFDNSGGTIEALAGSEVELTNSTIENGLLTTSADGLIRSVAGTNNFLKDLTNTGTIQADLNSDTGIEGTIDNQGMINIVSAGQNADLEVQSSGATLTGGGTVELSTNGAAISRVNGTSGSTLVIDDQTIQGSGNIGQNLLAIDVRGAGIVHALHAGQVLTVDAVGTAGDLINNGLFTASNGATLNVVGDFDNDGIIDAQSGSFVTATSSLISDGLIKGSGTIDSGTFISSNGIIAPGNSIGTLTFDADTVFGTGNELQIEIAGLAIHDVLDINGTADLDGFLNLELLSGYLPSATDVFTVMNSASSSSLTGSFSNVSNGGTLLTSDGSGSFTVNYVGGTVQLSNFSSSAVPEPGSLILVGGLLVGLTVKRRRSV